jgi:LacI family transcriptional regulator
MPVRMKDIAQDLGISVVAVSKALKDHKDISKETKERVRQRMKELNYRPNLVARSLTEGRTYTVALVVPGLMHSFFAEIAHGVGKTLRPKGYTLVLSNSEEDSEIEAKEIETLLARNVDGFIIASAHGDRSSTAFNMLREQKVPFILIDRAHADTGASFIGTDNVALGAMATNHLIEIGCRRIAHISCMAISTGQGRMDGYRQALAKAGIVTVNTADASDDDASGYTAMRQLLSRSPRPDGVFCFNDSIAAGAIKATLEAGLNVPEDIAFVGAGNVHYSELLRVPLTTVDQGASHIGTQAAELLLHDMQPASVATPRTVLMPLQLIQRDSTVRRTSKSHA